MPNQCFPGKSFLTKDKINRLTWSVLYHSDSDSYFPEWSQDMYPEKSHPKDGTS